MNFNDKLIFLMNIAQVSNKELAQGISVDPSLISLLRSGKRKRPTNPIHIENMANYFSTRCPAQFQRDALAEMLEQSDISVSLPARILAKRIEAWLYSDAGALAGVVEDIKFPGKNSPVIPANTVMDLKTSGTVFRLGTEGRNETINEFLQRLLASKKPQKVCVISDGELSWFLYNYSYSRKIQTAMCELARRGFEFYQIMPGTNHMVNYATTLQFWLPVYSTGQVHVYYYPRMCDDMYRRALLVCEECVRVSTAVGTTGKNDITTFSTDPELVHAYAAQFQETLEMCRPVLKVSDHMDTLSNTLKEFHSNPGEHIQLVSHLPSVTLPEELIDRIEHESSHPVYKDIFNQVREDSAYFIQQVENAPFLDIVPLLSAGEVKKGKALIGMPVAITPEHPRYTPETYILHLKHILHLIDTYENYHFLPYDSSYASLPSSYHLFVNECGLAVIVSTRDPLVMEMRQPEMVMACREYLMEVAARLNYRQSIQRSRVRLRLQNLINELQSI